MSRPRTEDGAVRPVGYMFIDTHQDRYTYAVAPEGRGEPEPARHIGVEPRDLRRVLRRLEKTYDLRICYEADGGGYELYRLVRDWGYFCEVMAPSLTPKAPGDKRKTDRHDGCKGAKLYRAGELTPIVVPTAQREEDRALVRLRSQLIKDQKRAKHQLRSALRLQGHVYRGGQNWTCKHRDWIEHLELSATNQFLVTQHLLRLDMAALQIQAANERIQALAEAPRYRELVAALRAFRGIDTLTAVTLCVEVGDFRRFPSPGSLMAFFGLTCGEDSSGDQQKHLSITKTGNRFCRTLMIEAAWHYDHRPACSKRLRDRQVGVPAPIVSHAWKAQCRLYDRFWHLARRKNRPVAAVAVARELVGFLWAATTKMVPPPPE